MHQQHCQWTPIRWWTKTQKQNLKIKTKEKINNSLKIKDSKDELGKKIKEEDTQVQTELASVEMAPCGEIGKVVGWV